MVTLAARTTWTQAQNPITHRPERVHPVGAQVWKLDRAPLPNPFPHRPHGKPTVATVGYMLARLRRSSPIGCVNRRSHSRSGGHGYAVQFPVD